MMKGTQLWPSLDEWENKILFFETSEDKPLPMNIRWYLRIYVSLAIIDKVKGIIVGKPYGETYFREYIEEFLKVIREEAGRRDLPILCNFNIGHTAPMCILPFGVKARIDCVNKKIEILESATKWLY